MSNILYKCDGCWLLLMILITPSDVSPGVHPHKDLPSCHQPNGYRPRLDKMVSTGDPQLRGTHDQWLVLITPSDVSLGVHPHRDLPSCHQPKGYRPVSTRWSPPVILICVVLMITVAR